MSKAVLEPANIKLNEIVNTKEDAITATGEILVKQGYVVEDYILAMLQKEKLISSYMGNCLAITHGGEGSEKYIKKSGIAILQVPDGVDFGNGNEVKILVGFAVKGGQNLDILSKIAFVCADEENVQQMVEAKDENVMIDLLGELK